MAGVANSARLSARLASRYAAPPTRRAFHLTASQRAAQNYTMPALSPTMTEGNIATWRVKEGDSFSAGDVICEIETDKATMDVEAQDEGVLFKIMQPDGAKGVKVGQRIAVLAEEGDDLGSLEVPAEEKVQQTSAGKEESKKQDSAPTNEAVGGSKEIDSGAADSNISKPVAESPPTKPKGGKTRNPTYPLFPAVQQLLHENGLSTEDANQIPVSGPNGRLLKGDVLAYLGKISQDYPSQSSSRLEKLSHLDLTNIQLAKPAPKPEEAAPPTSSAAAEPSLPTETEIAVPISLTAVLATQKRVHDTLSIWLPLSTFIARASDLANQHLPARKHRTPTADDLFNAVLGLDKLPTSTRGHFIPEVTGISPMPPAKKKTTTTRKPDLIDLLAPKSSSAAKAASPSEISAALGVSAGDNVFSVVAKRGEEERATEFLERMKETLEREPGRLVL